MFETGRFVRRRDEARFRQLSGYQLPRAEVERLAELAHELGLLFVATPFDLGSAEFLEPLVDAYKIASGDNDFWPLIDAVADTGKPVIASTGLLDLDGTAALADRLRGDFALLHCVSAYPAAPEDLNLAAIPLLEERFGCTVGYSDHALGLEAAVAAAGVGARIIEKHLTLRHDFSDFRDHQLSADPRELHELVERVADPSGAATRRCSGAPRSASSRAEEANMVAARRSIAAVRDLPSGHTVARGGPHLAPPARRARPGRGAPARGQGAHARRAGGRVDPRRGRHMSCPMCGGTELEPVFRYDEPPPGETPFGARSSTDREYRRCAACGHFLGVTSIDLDELYSGEYVDATYSADGIASTYERIMSLPPERSDNVQRVARIRERLGDARDACSTWAAGLARLPGAHEARRAGPARRSTRIRGRWSTRRDRRRGRGGVRRLHGGRRPRRASTSSRSTRCSSTCPSRSRCSRARASSSRPAATCTSSCRTARRAAADPDGPNREEFFIEHLHVFSMSSMSLLADRAGLVTRVRRAAPRAERQVHPLRVPEALGPPRDRVQHVALAVEQRRHRR